MSTGTYYVFSWRNKKHIKQGGYKTFFMLNSAEHEIFPANKYENANNSWHFSYLLEQ